MLTSTFKVVHQEMCLSLHLKQYIKKCTYLEYMWRHFLWHGRGRGGDGLGLGLRGAVLLLLPRKLRLSTCFILKLLLHELHLESCACRHGGMLQLPLLWTVEETKKNGKKTANKSHTQTNGLVQERRNSSALAMELRLSCINPPKR